MRHLILAVYGAAFLALVPGFAQAQLFRERPAPPSEPSVVIAEKPAAAKLEPEPPKPIVLRKVVRRPGKGPTGPVTMPPPEVLVMMVRAALAGVNQANFTENYSVLHAMTTPALQARSSVAQFAKAFSDLRKQKLDLSPALVLLPQFTVTPSITPQGALKLAGIFPSRPVQINFAIDYLPIDGFWLIDTLSVSTLQVATPAPAAISNAPPATATTSTSSATASQLLRTPAKSAFWEPRFVKKTHFGPRLSFAANP